MFAICSRLIFNRLMRTIVRRGRFGTARTSTVYVYWHDHVNHLRDIVQYLTSYDALLIRDERLPLLIAQLAIVLHLFATNLERRLLQRSRIQIQVVAAAASCRIF